MILPLGVQPLPLDTDRDGVVRVGGTRVTLETLVGEFLSGSTAEEIAANFPVLRLADVYSVIGYYLQEREAVDAYIGVRQAKSEKMRRESQRQNQSGYRDELLARKASASS